MIADILEKNDETSFQSFLEKCEYSSIQSSLHWRNLICDLEEDEPYFVIAKENDEIVGALPLYYYRNKLGNILTGSVWHTISGILYSGPHTKQVFKKLLDYSFALAKELDCKVLSIGTNPFLNDKECYLDCFQPDYVMENFVQYIRLNEIFDGSSNCVHPNYLRRSNLSRNIKVAKRQITICDDQSKEYVDQCFKIHEKRMKELNAVPFPKRFFESALKNLTLMKKGKFLFAFHDQKMVAGCLFLSNKNMIDVYMMCMDSDFRYTRANFMLTYHMLDSACIKGIPILHWMSSPRRGDGVYKWKEQWGSHERNFLYLTKIIGDISQWKNMDVDELKEAYKFRYLLPFNLLKNPNSNFTTKDELTSFMQSLEKRST